nr:growth factor receptor bound protein 7 [Hymenolepis microstoma]
MDLQRQWPAAIVPSRIWFRPNRRKYIFTEDLDLLLLSKDTNLKGDVLDNNISFPGISEGIVMLKRPHGKWSKVLCFLVMSAIFFSKRHFGYSKKNSKYLLDLTSMDVYVPQERTDVTKLLHTPTPHTLLLVPSSIGLLDPDSIFAIGCKTRESMLAWAEGLRLHKHSQRKLSENLENVLNHYFTLQVDAPKRYRGTTEIMGSQIITPTNTVVVNSKSPKSNRNGSQIGAMSPRTFDFNTETLSLFKQDCSPQQDFFENDYQSRNENLATLRRWSACSSEDNQPYFHFRGNLEPDMNSSVSTLESSVETKSLTPNSNSGQSFLHQELVGQSNAYVQEGTFEGIVFQSGVPHLLLELPDGLHKYSIEVNQDRGFDEKRYKLPSRPERFETLSDLCNFYEKQRNLLLEDENLKEISPSSHCPLNHQDESATAF